LAGEVLRKRREDLSHNIKEVSELLKINSDYLVSIENDSFENLPVEVYTKGYIRCYAKYLDIDPEPILQYYTDHISRPNPSILIPVTFFKRKRSKLFYLIPVFFMTFFAFYIFFSLPGGINEKTSLNSNNRGKRTLIKYKS
jgi:cytoskeletal protein RodZ